MTAMQRILPFLRSDDLPLLTRRNYAAELPQIALWGVVAGTVEGSMASVVASKTFQASSLLTTVVWALPVLMNVLNVAWGAFLRGRRRLPVFLLLSCCALAAVGSIGFTSAAWQPWGGWVFALQIACTHLFISGLINLRSTMWKINYPVTHRARIAGRLQMVRMLLSVLTSAALSLLYNYQPDAYRFVYPAAALVGLFSLWPIRRMRMRGERAELRHLHDHLVGHIGPDLPWHRRFRRALAEAGSILWTDGLFARYMLAQFLLGAANFFTDPILVNALTKDLGFDYLSAQAVLYVIPTTALLISINFWAPYFDRVGVLRFRIANSFCWLMSYVAAAAAMLIFDFGGHKFIAATVAILVVGRVCNGLGRGGGAIAWTLGHLHFARPHQAELYMGIHVGLTGLRGLLMPLAGLWTREAFGYPALLCAVGFALAGHVLFWRLAIKSGSTRPPAS